jgi:glycerophosphoryl diester phosphodiesterase
MLLLGHRGCRGELTENTFAAFDHAIECGCDGFEFDVRLSSDAIPVVWHDARVRGRFIARHTFGKLSERCAMAASSRGPRIRQLLADVGRRPSPATPRLLLKPKDGLNGTPAIELCRLEEVLARYAHVGWMDIELKVRGMEAQVAELLRRYRPARGFVVSSFRRPVLLDLHRIAPGLPLAYIFKRMPREKTWRELPIQFVKPSARLVTPARVRQFHAAGMKVLTWTVNRPAAMRRLSEAGVDGMIGDDPAVLAASRIERFEISKFQG